MTTYLSRLAPDCTREKLWTRITTTLVLAAEHVEQLDTLAMSWDEDRDPFIRMIDKIAMETALLAMLVARVPEPPATVRLLLDRVARAVARHAYCPRNEILLMRFPSTAASLGIAPIVLAALGHGDPRFHQLVESALTAGHAHALERLPFREMDLRWILELHDGTPAVFDDLFPQSLIARRPHPIYMSRADAYAYTHALMYMSDFGSRPLPPAVDVDDVAASVDASLLMYLFTEDLDLLGELVLSAVIARRPPSPHARLAWAAIDRIWDEFGLLPGPSFMPADFARLDGMAARAYAFRHTYHTTYVGAMLAATLLLRGDDPCDAWAPAAHRDPDTVAACADAAARAARFCDVSVEDLVAPACQWTGTIAALAGRLGRSCEPLWATGARGSSLSDDELLLALADGVLIRAAREYDLAALSAALIAMARSGLPPSRTVAAAASFLARQSLACGALGAHFVDVRNDDTLAADEVTRALSAALRLAGSQLGGAHVRA
jgi:hypothetical protein